MLIAKRGAKECCVVVTRWPSSFDWPYSALIPADDDAAAAAAVSTIATGNLPAESHLLFSPYSLHCTLLFTRFHSRVGYLPSQLFCSLISNIDWPQKLSSVFLHYNWNCLNLHAHWKRDSLSLSLSLSLSISISLACRSTLTHTHWSQLLRAIAIRSDCLPDGQNGWCGTAIALLLKQLGCQCSREW